MSGRVFWSPPGLPVQERERNGRIEVPRHLDPPVKTLAGRALVVCHDLVNVNPGAFGPPVGVKTNLVPPASAILPTRGGPFS